MHSYEELLALLDSRDIDITALPENVLDNASYFGRIFAHSGLSDAVAEGLRKQHLDANYIEGMACVNGCIGGAVNLAHGEKNKAVVDSYGREVLEKTILDAIAPLR